MNLKVKNKNLISEDKVIKINLKDEDLTKESKNKWFKGSAERGFH